ncbi:MAG: hypothetical protein RR394_02785 [Oscillospiraceae bacterium]
MKKAYIVHLYDGENCLKLKANVPAENEEAARKHVQGCGEIIAVELDDSRTADNPIRIDCIYNALCNADFGQLEIDLITRALSDCEFIG